MRTRALTESPSRDSDIQRVFAVEEGALGLFEWDVVTNEVRWSQSDEIRLGLRPGSVTDFDSWSEHVFPEDVLSTRARIAHAAEQRRDRFAFHYRLRGHDGKVRTIEGAARCIYDAGGALVKTYGVNIDISQRVEREATLRSREAQLESILATMPDAMVMVDARGHILGSNAAAERLFDYSAAELTGLNITALAADSARARLSAHFDAYRDAHGDGAPGTRFDLVARRNGGAEVAVELCISAAVAAAEHRYTVFVRDRCNRETVEQATNALRNELAQVGRIAAMGELAASLAHELNQPLSATANFLAATVMLVERDGDRDKVAELVSLANEQIQRAGSIIRRIREFIVKREVEVGIEPVEKTVRDAVSLVLVGASRMEVDVRYAFDHKGAFMLADRVQIQQVLVNLLRNATEALNGQPKHRRTILISARGRPDDMIEISVSDTGPGIDGRMLENIFTPLSSTKGADGMGLGLSICRRIIEAHGGLLTAENRSAGGATFRFTLPAVSLEEARQA